MADSDNLDFSGKGGFRFLPPTLMDGSG